MPTPELIRLAVAEWSNQLAGLTAAQVKRGLESWTEDWPPSSPEFRKACLGEQGSLHKSGAYKLFKGLPKPPQNKELASKYLAAMKRLLV